MLIGCITGPDFQTAKSQIAQAKKWCDAVEFREDLITEDISSLKGEMPIFDCNAISTYHNFEETPEDLEGILDQMPKSKIYKIATMAHSITDSLRMLAFVKRHQNIAGMCMGPFGGITRILAPIVGSPLTFAALGNPAALGQMQAEELVLIYHFHRLSPKTKIYGLIGHPVSQSPSHITHNRYFRENGLDAVYVKMDVSQEELPHFFELIKELGVQGLSVTIPYKEKLFPYIDQLDEKAKKIGGVNTLTFGEKVTGSNTDCTGALDAIEQHQRVLGKKMVILGEGGSAKAIAFEAKARGAEVVFCSRKRNNLYPLPSHDILVNTIPSDIPIEVQKDALVMDINFNRQNSPHMLQAKKKIFGEEMFSRQAKAQFVKWGQIPSS